MRILAILAFLCISTNLIGCSAMRGNVVPQTGPSMEQVYDSMGVNPQPTADNQTIQKESDLTEIRQNLIASKSSGRKVKVMDITAEANTFRKLPNPELTMYVYPHLAGNAEVPIPGYITVFNAYASDHYVLPKEFY